MTWDDFFSEQLQAGEGYSYVVDAGSDVYLFEVSSGSTADKLSVKITKYRYIVHWWTVFTEEHRTIVDLWTHYITAFSDIEFAAW